MQVNLPEAVQGGAEIVNQALLDGDVGMLRVILVMAAQELPDSVILELGATLKAEQDKWFSALPAWVNHRYSP